eukprot:s2077_g9.t1
MFVYDVAGWFRVRELHSQSQVPPIPMAARLTARLPIHLRNTGRNSAFSQEVGWGVSASCRVLRLRLCWWASGSPSRTCAHGV